MAYNLRQPPVRDAPAATEAPNPNPNHNEPDNDAQAPEAASRKTKSKWKWNSDQKDVDYIDLLNDFRPHLAPHGSITKKWLELEVKFKSKYADAPALNTLKGRYDTLVESLKAEDKTIYLSGSNQALKPQMEILRNYLAEVESFEKKSDNEKLIEQQRNERAQITLATALTQVANTLPMNPPPRAPAPAQRINDIDDEMDEDSVSSSATSSTSKPGKRKRDNDDPFLSLISSTQSAEEEKLVFKKAKLEEERSQRDREIQRDKERMQLERDRFERENERHNSELELRREELKLREQELKNEAKKLEVEEKRQNDMQTLLLRLLSEKKS